MAELEKAIRYLCFFETEDREAQANRYLDIERMIKGDNDLIEKYVKKYEKILDLLAS